MKAIKQFGSLAFAVAMSIAAAPLFAHADIVPFPAAKNPKAAPAEVALPAIKTDANIAAEKPLKAQPDNDSKQRSSRKRLRRCGTTSTKTRQAGEAKAKAEAGANSGAQPSATQQK